MLGIPSGKLGGVPSAVEKVTISEFTIRITNSNYLVADRTFSITVAGILPQTIIPVSTDLGTYVDGTFIELDINTIESNPYLDSTFSIIEGELPLGLSLNADCQTGPCHGVNCMITLAIAFQSCKQCTAMASIVYV